jgi:hypothetical protein
MAPVNRIMAWGIPTCTAGDLIPPLSDQPAALVLRHVVFLDRLLDRGLLIRGVIDDADELRRHPADVVDRPGGVTLLDRSLRHCGGTIGRAAEGAYMVSMRPARSGGADSNVLGVCVMGGAGTPLPSATLWQALRLERTLD